MCVRLAEVRKNNYLHVRFESSSLVQDHKGRRQYTNYNEGQGLTLYDVHSNAVRPASRGPARVVAGVLQGC